MEQLNSKPVTSGAREIRPEDFRYKRVEEALGRIFNVPGEGLGAFRARLRNLRNMGIPNLPKTGSGTKIGYSREQVTEILIALELSRLGIAPRFVGDIAKAVLECTPETAEESRGYDSPVSDCKAENVFKRPACHALETLSSPIVRGQGLLALQGLQQETIIFSSPGIYDKLRAWAFLKDGKGLFLIVYPTTQFSTEGKYRWQVQRLTDRDILKTIKDHPSVAFVNVSSSIKALEQHLR